MHPKRIELLARVRAGAVVVLDVRPVEEYEAGHVSGAVSLPLEHLEARLDDLDPALEVVAYCRGPLCLLAPQAVEERSAAAARAWTQGPSRTKPSSRVLDDQASKR